MSVAARDIKMREMIRMAAAHRAALKEGFSDMKERSNQNKYLKEVIEDYKKGIQEMIDGLQAQKEALIAVMEHLESLCGDKTCKKKDVKRDLKRVLREIKLIDKKIREMTLMLKE